MGKLLYDVLMLFVFMCLSLPLLLSSTCQPMKFENTGYAVFISHTVSMELPAYPVFISYVLKML